MSEKMVRLSTALAVASGVAATTHLVGDVAALTTVRTERLRGVAGASGKRHRITSQRYHRARLTAIFAGKSKNSNFLQKGSPVGRVSPTTANGIRRLQSQAAMTRRLSGQDSCQCGKKEKNYAPVDAFPACGDKLSGDCVFFNEWEYFSDDGLPAETMRYRYWASALDSGWKMACYGGQDPLEILVCPPGKKVRFELPNAAHSIVDITIRDSTTGKVDMVQSYENFRHCRFPHDSTVLAGLDRSGANAMSYEFECTEANRGCHVLADPGTLDTGDASYDATSFTFCSRDNLRTMIQVVSQEDWDGRAAPGVDITRDAEYGCRAFLKPALQNYCKGSYLECGRNSTAVEFDFDPSAPANRNGDCSVVAKSAGGLGDQKDYD